MRVPLLNVGQWIKLGASGGFEFNWCDPDGDALVKYEIKTSRRAQSFWSNSLRYFDAVGGQEVPLSDLSNLWIRGHFTGIRQSFEIRAYDGRTGVIGFRLRSRQARRTGYRL